MAAVQTQEKPVEKKKGLRALFRRKKPDQKLAATKASEQKQKQQQGAQKPVHHGLRRGVRVNTRELLQRNSNEHGTDLTPNSLSFIEHLKKNVAEDVTEFTLSENTAKPRSEIQFTAAEDDLSNYRHMRLNANLDRALACGPSRDSMGHRGLDENEHPAVEQGLDTPLAIHILALIDACSATNVTEQSYMETLQSQIRQQYEPSALSARSDWTTAPNRRRSQVASTAESQVLTNLNKKAAAVPVNQAQVNQVLGKMTERGEISVRDIGMIKRRIYARARHRGDKIHVDDIRNEVEPYRKMSLQPRSAVETY